MNGYTLLDGLRAAYINVYIDNRNGLHGYALDKDSITLVKDTLHLLLNTGFTCRETKELIRGYSYNALSRAGGFEGCKRQTLKSRAYRGMEAVKGLLPDDTFTRLLFNNMDDVEIKALSERVREELKKQL